MLRCAELAYSTVLDRIECRLHFSPAKTHDLSNYFETVPANHNSRHINISITVFAYFCTLNKDYSVKSSKDAYS